MGVGRKQNSPRRVFPTNFLVIYIKSYFRRFFYFFYAPIDDEAKESFFISNEKKKIETQRKDVERATILRYFIYKRAKTQSP